MGLTKTNDTNDHIYSYHIDSIFCVLNYNGCMIELHLFNLPCNDFRLLFVFISTAFISIDSTVVET